MITDEIMDVLNRMIDLITGTAYSEGIMMAQDALAEFDLDEWLSMTQSEKDDWLAGVIRKQVTLK